MIGKPITYHSDHGHYLDNTTFEVIDTFDDLEEFPEEGNTYMYCVVVNSAGDQCNFTVNKCWSEDFGTENYPASTSNMSLTLIS